MNIFNLAFIIIMLIGYIFGIVVLIGALFLFRDSTKGACQFDDNTPIYFPDKENSK